jgi:hypothetical protein
MRHTQKMPDKTHAMEVMELYCFAFRTVVTEYTEYTETDPHEVPSGFPFCVLRVFRG